jgi:hypothetical protein
MLFDDAPTFLITGPHTLVNTIQSGLQGENQFLLYGPELKRSSRESGASILQCGPQRNHGLQIRNRPRKLLLLFAFLILINAVMIRTTVLWTALFLYFFYLTGTTLAQQNPISWFVDKTLGQVADELKNAGTVLINRAGIEGNALLSQAGNQANVAAANIVYLFSDQLDKRYQELAPQLQAIIEQLARFRQTPDEVLRGGERLVDKMTVNFMEIVRTLPFSHVPDFYVERLDGLVQLLRDHDVDITITGIGVGQSNSDQQNAITKILLEGAPVAFQTTLDAHSATIALSHDVIKQYLPDVTAKKASIVRLSIESQTKRKGLLGWGNPDAHSVPVSLTLLPAYAGPVTITATYRQKEWVIESPDQRWPFTTPAYNYPGGMPSKIYSHDVDVGHQLRNPRVTSETTNGYPWSDLNTYPNLPRATPYITNNGTRIEIVVRNWGPSFTFWLWADVYKMDFGEPHSISEDIDLYYGKLLQFNLPVEAASWRITGKSTFDGGDIDITTGSINSPYLVHLQDVIQNDGTRVISYEVPIPKGLLP